MGRSVHEPVRVALAADEQYALPLAAAGRSVIDARGPGVSVEIAVLSCGLSTMTKHRLRRSWCGGASTVSFHDVDVGALPAMDNTASALTHITPATYARFLLPALLPEHWRRVIYLDTDTITRACLCPLTRVELGEAGLAAVTSPGIPTVSSGLGVQRWREEGLNPEAPYFNAGVLVIDLDAWRSGPTVHDALRYLDHHRDASVLFDQEALNAAVAGRFTPLGQEWNVMSTWHDDDARVGEHADILDRARIRHFTGPSKPWTDPEYEASGAAAFFRALDRTVWRGWRPVLGDGSTPPERIAI